MRAAFVIMCFVAVAADPSCAGTHPRAVELAPLFGPVVGPQPIVGRADLPDGRVLMLLRDVGLLTIDVARRESHVVVLPGDLTHACWGLVRTAAGLWMLKDRHTLARLDATGAVLQEWPLRDAHLGLIGAGERLVYQTLTAQAVRYEIGPPGTDARESWAQMAPRSFALNPTLTVPLNLFSCGESRTADRPCWFPDESTLTIVGQAGSARRVPLEGMVPETPEHLITSDAASRPIRDVLMDDRTFWVLATGAPPPGGTGAWELRKHDDGGKLLHTFTLPGGARAILQAGAHRIALLTADGMVAEVRP